MSYLGFILNAAVFLFGIIIGSYLNVFILRINTGRHSDKRSVCLNCGKTLRAHELVPILSFIFQKGRCAKCLSRIAFQYPAVEILNATIYLLSFIFIEDKLLAIFSWPLFSILLAISVYDIKHKIIPELMMQAFYFAVSIPIIYLLYKNFSFDWLLQHTFASLIFSASIFLPWLASKGRAMGLGDLKISLPLFFILFPSQAFLAILITFWSGALFGLFIILISKSKIFGKSFNFKSEIAFVPFIFLGFLIPFLFELSFYDIIYLWF